MISACGAVLHEIYISIFVTISATALLINITKQKTKVKIWITLILCFFLFCQILLGSKLGLFIYLFVILGFILNIFQKKIKSQLLKYSFFCACFLLIAFASFQNPRMKNEIQKTYHTINATGIKNYDFENNAILDRLSIWINSVDLIKENYMFGVGSGNVKKALSTKLEQKGLKMLASKGYNCHNQFLETFLGLGIFGLLTLILLFVIPLYYSIKNKDLLLFVFVGSMFLFAFVESFLYNITGIMFFAFFYNLLVTRSICKKESPFAWAF